MKKVLEYLLAALLTLIYSAGTIGVAVYICHCSHSGQIVLLADDDCLCRHECHDCCDHDREQATDEHACDIKYQILQLDQEVNNSLSAFNSYSTTNVFFLPATLNTTPLPRLVANYNYDPPPLEYLSSPNIYCLSQLRL